MENEKMSKFKFDNHSGRQSMSDIADKMGAINFYHRNQVTKIHSTNNEISLLPVFADKNIKAQRVVSHMGTRDKQRISKKS